MSSLSRALTKGGTPGFHDQRVSTHHPPALARLATPVRAAFSSATHPEHVLQHRLDEARRRAARQKATRERRRARKKA
jgi:hypothetical protein